MNKQSPVIDIALATYNGSRFLQPLLQSLQKQVYPQIRLCVSDDGSTDSTLDVIKQSCGSMPISFAPFNPRGNILRNFENALSITTAPYVSLCDQDDVWSPHKISALLESMQKTEGQYGKDTPIVVFCDLEIVDEQLRTISSSFFKSTLKSSHARAFGDFVLNNHVPGCAMLVNRALLNCALPFPELDIHDHWLIQIAALCGRVECVDLPLVKYRQHSANNIGLGSAGRRGSAMGSILRSLPAKIKVRALGWRMQALAIYNNLEALHNRVGPTIREADDINLIAAVLEPADVWRLGRLLRNAVTGERFIDRWAIIWLLSRRHNRGQSRPKLGQY